MTKYTVMPIGFPICDLSNMEQIECGEAVMNKRLVSLGWSKTEGFGGYNIYRNRDNEVIGVTVYRPQDGPCEHTHYALKLPDNG